MRFSVRLPDGTVKAFAHVETFAAYVRGWPDAHFDKVWPLPFFCLIHSKVAPF